ncbi:MAG TPA: glycosyltransferase [Solibacterales bacterium]|nr:glycosyltransferase [Bryobacterales bacterium]
MKVVIFGLSISSSWGNGHATLWRALCRAMVRRGHRPVFFERDVEYYASHRDLHSIEGGRLVLYSDWDATLADARRELSSADAGMVTSYCPDGVAATRLVLDTNLPLRCFYDLDTPVTLDALQSGEPVAYLTERGLSDFDLVLSYTGGRALTELSHRLGARLALPLYGSVDPDVHHPVPGDAEQQSDLSYLGTFAEDRQASLVDFFIEPARRLPSRRFCLGGAQYRQDFPWTSNIFFRRHVPPAAHPAFYCSSDFTLNITRRAMRAMGYCPSGRLFEAAACGVPILTDTWEGLEEFFTPGRAAAGFIGNAAALGR